MHVLQCHRQLHYPVHHHLLIKTLPFLLVLCDLPIKVTPLQGHPKQKSVLQFLHDLKTHPFLVLCDLPTKVTPARSPKTGIWVLQFVYDLKTHPLLVPCDLPTKVTPCSKVTQNRNQSVTIFTWPQNSSLYCTLWKHQGHPHCKVTQNRNQCYNLYMTSKPHPFLYSVIFTSRLTPCKVTQNRNQSATIFTWPQNLIPFFCTLWSSHQGHPPPPPLQGHPKQESVLQFVHDLKTHPLLVLCDVPIKFKCYTT